MCKQKESVARKLEIKQAIQMAYSEAQMTDLADRLQNSFYRYVQRTEGNYDLKVK